MRVGILRDRAFLGLQTDRPTEQVNVHTRRRQSLVGVFIRCSGARRRKRTTHSLSCFRAIQQASRWLLGSLLFFYEFPTAVSFCCCCFFNFGFEWKKIGFTRVPFVNISYFFLLFQGGEIRFFFFFDGSYLLILKGSRPYEPHHQRRAHLSSCLYLHAFLECTQTQQY